MTQRKVFIQTLEFVPHVAEILGMDALYLEYEFRKSRILGLVYSFEADLTPEQAAEINRRANEIER